MATEVNIFLLGGVAAGYLFSFTNQVKINDDLKVIIKAFTIIGIGYIAITYFDPIKQALANIFKGFLAQ